MYSRRIERLAETLKQEVSKAILYKLKDPRISFVTVTNVDASPDFKNAKVYLSILGDDPAQKKTLQVLTHAKGVIQAEVGRHLHTRNTPHLTFYLDESAKKSIRISKIIDDAIKESNNNTIESELVE
ncbi:MAG: 30S ribosome-binding factor RbfA [Candidatus Brocadiaceae bacterium]|nr:30S ribosome-binding factor RbfA [Candidatus Brocadiaceae bacterium]